MTHDIDAVSDSDIPILAAIEQLFVALSGERTTAQLFESLEIKILSVVLDANIIFIDIGRFLRTQKATALLLAARSGFVRFYYSTEVRSEVLEHLAELTSKHATSDEALRVWKKHYEPFITALDPASIKKLSSRALRVQAVDPDDLDTAKVSDLLRPHTVLSLDHSLNPYHPGQTLTEKNWTELAAAYRDWSNGQMVFVSLSFGGGVSLMVAMSSIEALISLLLKVDSRIMFTVGLGLMLAGGLAFAHPTSRKWLNERMRAAGTWSQEHLVERVVEVLDTLAQLADQTKEANGFLEERQLEHEPPQLARDYLIEVLAHTHAYLTVREISLRMQNQGYEPKGEHPERYVARMLRENPGLFKRYGSRLWGLP
ncbi:MAG TPA: PIN domain-containing protein [Ktedonobacterales bacterium]